MQRVSLGLGGLMMGVLLALATVPHAKSAAHDVSVTALTPDAREQRIKLAGIGNSSAYLPTGTIRGTMLFLSDEQGWTSDTARLARKLSDNGFAVAGIPTPIFRKAFYAGKGCANPNYLLTTIAKDFEHKLGFAHYDKPAVIGAGTGAALVYGALAEAQPNIYRGGITLGLSPTVLGAKPWCAADGLTLSRTYDATMAPGWRFSPPASLPIPLVALENPAQSAAVARFLAQAPQAKTVVLQPNESWITALTPRISPWFDTASPAEPGGRSLSDLPIALSTDPAAPPGKTMAILYSGDGGWAGIDRDIAAALAARGVPSVGVDSLAYFWTARTPQEAGHDLDRLITHYSALWHKPRVVLIGYSFGADDLAYIVGTLPPDARARISRVSFLGLSPTADFQFHLASWLDIAGADALPTAPAIAKLRGLPMQCVRGTEESDSACPSLPATLAEQDILPGGHHFDGNTTLVASTILQGLRL
ncbi:virulence factor family protein [Caenibius tardaugens]|nr:AcvB/VirJ family lysyl-phosphatidylglycerol hydrolase [Caenibius tardaugens]